MAHKDYRDPLYGFIGVNEFEQRIIDSFPFQRLRRIKQLGTTFLVYPTANHTRFEHSLGTMEISTRLFDALTSKQNCLEILNWDKVKVEYYRKLLRYAALLHDIGHAPFSHTAETLFPEGNDHELYTYNIITSTEIGTCIICEDLGKDARYKIAEIATGDAKGRDEAFLSELLTGDFGSDRLDYLIRDSYHLGVSYGKFDTQRILNTLEVRYNGDKEGPELVVEDGGVHSIEGFLLARYFMFLEVYYHKTRRILDIHLTEFIKTELENNCFPSSIDKFLNLDDYDIFRLLKQKRKKESAKRLCERQHFRLAFETTDHPSPHEIERFD
ncbi:MAG: HD domain-containing protein [Firmicutes bacterium]|nr:HD domain-containing protein [Bacillota bacterium]